MGNTNPVIIGSGHGLAADDEGHEEYCWVPSASGVRKVNLVKYVLRDYPMAGCRLCLKITEGLVGERNGEMATL